MIQRDLGDGTYASYDEPVSPPVTPGHEDVDPGQPGALPRNRRTLMNSNAQQKAPHGRSLRVSVFGNTAAELEQAALDEARAFFGGGPVLRVAQDYAAERINPTGYYAKQAAGKLYIATLSVQAVPAAQARLCDLLGRLRARMQAGRP